MPKWSHLLDQDEDDEQPHNNFQKIRRGQRTKPEEDRKKTPRVVEVPMMK